MFLHTVADKVMTFCFTNDTPQIVNGSFMLKAYPQISYRGRS